MYQSYNQRCLSTCPAHILPVCIGLITCSLNLLTNPLVAQVPLIFLGSDVHTHVDEPGEPGFHSLFDGQTLDGWQAAPSSTTDAWTVQDGVLVGNGDRGVGYLIYTRDKQLSNFELRFRYRFVGRGNSGVSIRAVHDPTKKRLFQSYHADLGHAGIGKQILGAWDFHTPKRTEHRCHRGDRLVIDKQDKPEVTPIKDGLTKNDIRPRDWNDARIIARNNHFQFYINHKLASEFTENLPPNRRLGPGMLMLQIHDRNMVVHFKDLRIKRLD